LYPAKNPFSGKFSHTTQGVGQWWEVKFTRDYMVDRVKMLNRKDCCGDRLGGTKVYVDDKYCGAVPNGTKNG